MGTKSEQSVNNNPKVGQEWEQSETKVEPKSGTRMGTKWEQSGNKNQKVDKNGNKVEPKVGRGTQKWDKKGNKVGTKWEEEPKSETRMGTK